MIDNLSNITPLLEFNSKDDFYYLQILQRKKENSLTTSNSRVIRNYHIHSVDYLLNHYDEIRKLCGIFNARASIRLNRRSYKAVVLHTIVALSNHVLQRDYPFGRKAYDRAIGRNHNEPKKRWIVDIDDIVNKRTTMRWLTSMTNFIDRECRPEGVKFITLLESKSGYHLITYAFDVSKFKEKYPEIEVHKDNPTNLFIP